MQSHASLGPAHCENLGYIVGCICMHNLPIIDLIRLTRAPTLAANSNHLRGRSTQLQLLQTILLRALCTFPGYNHQLIQYIDLCRHKKTTLEARRAHSQREVTKFAKALQHCRRAASPQTSLLPCYYGPLATCTSINIRKLLLFYGGLYFSPKVTVEWKHK